MKYISIKSIISLAFLLQFSFVECGIISSNFKWHFNLLQMSLVFNEILSLVISVKHTVIFIYSISNYLNYIPREKKVVNIISNVHTILFFVIRRNLKKKSKCHEVVTFISIGRHFKGFVFFFFFQKRKQQVCGCK